MKITTARRGFKKKMKKKREPFGVLGNRPNTPSYVCCTFGYLLAYPPSKRTHLFSCGNKTLDVSPLHTISSFQSVSKIVERYVVE